MPTKSGEIFVHSGQGSNSGSGKPNYSGSGSDDNNEIPEFSQTESVETTNEHLQNIKKTT